MSALNVALLGLAELRAEAESACSSIVRCSFAACETLADVEQRTAQGGLDLVLVLGRTIQDETLRGLTSAVKVPLIVASKSLTTDQVVEVMRLGAYSATGFGAPLQATLQAFVSDRRGDLLRPRWSESERTILRRVVARSPQMQETVEQMRIIAQSPRLSAILHGETGTGKELVANTIHRLSARAEHPFIAVDCGAIPENLVESELFGHVRGAFSGAVADHAGRFVLANKGTLFLDEIAELPLLMQSKLLRVLEEREVWPVGASKPTKVDVRLLSASHNALSDLVAAGKFREDLFFRLGSFVLEIPPLRKRGADIIHIAEHYLQQFATEQAKNVIGFSNQACAALMAHTFPGNVRELRNIVERAVAVAKGERIEQADIVIQVRAQTQHVTRAPAAFIPAGAKQTLHLHYGEGALDDVIKQAYLAALDEADHNRTVAARLLGISRTSFVAGLKRFGIGETGKRGRPKKS